MILDNLLSSLSVSASPFATCELAPGWRLNLPGAPSVLLHFVLEGHGALEGTDGEKRPLAPHSLALVPNGMRHALETTGPILEEQSINSVPSDPGILRISAGPIGKAGLFVACGLIQVRYGLALDLFHDLRRILVVDLSSVPKIPTLFREIFEEQRQRVPGSGAMTGALMTQCLLHLFRRLPSEGDRALPWLSSLQDPRLGRVIESVLADPAKPHTLESLAGEAAMSRSAFADLFTNVLGRPPINFVHHVRMQRAMEMLSAPTLSIDEVARQVGFSSRSHFAQAFKKHTGVPPHAYREKPSGESELLS